MPEDYFSDLLHNALPSPVLIVWLLPGILIYSLLAVLLVSYLKKQRNIRTAYTRKIFHFLIFSFAGILQLYIGLSAVALLGMVMVFFILYAVYRGDGYPFYEALARPSDIPKRSLFILIPLLTTAVGGILSNIFFPGFAVVGYFVGGFGDAIGEPVGAKWGRHRYKVLSLAGVPAYRSIEGSLAVLAVSFLAAFLSLYLLGFTVANSLKVGALCALAGTLVEAVSNHGLDNLTMQLAAAGVADIFLEN